MAGRVLAVDPGVKRVGLALSDPAGILASPLRTLAAEPLDNLPERLAGVADEVDAVEIVVGLPRRLDGSEGPEAAAARRLAGSLRKLGRRPVCLLDERMSSAQAEKQLIASGLRRDRRKEVVDQLAATLILQSYLERRRGRAS